MLDLCFVGLANPGAKYDKTRHNIGKDWLISLGQSYGITFQSKQKYQAEIAYSHEEKIMWAIPENYVNNSGLTVEKIKKYTGLPYKKIIIFHDDLDLEPGEVKIKVNGGHAGHNGLRDIIRHCDNDFMRVRLGVGHPGNKTEVTNYVLKNASKSLRDTVNQNIENAISVLPTLILQGIQEAMKELHTASENSNEDNNKCQ